MIKQRDNRQRDNGLSLKDDIASIRTDSIFHDVVIVCADNVEIGACRAILASRCPFFMAMFYGNGNMQESTSRSITLKDITSPVMDAVLCFIHTEAIDSIEDSLVVKLYLAANFLLLPKLKRLVLGLLYNRNIETATSLLNESIKLVPWSENTKDLYDVLLNPFCAQSLAVGDIKGLSGEALELLLMRTTTRRFKTSEDDLFLCVAEWAWARDSTAPSADDRRATCDTLKNLSMASSIDPKAPLGNGPSGTPLLRMFRHLDLALIRPHLPKREVEAINVLNESTEFNQPESDIYGFPQHGYFLIRSLMHKKDKKILDVSGGCVDPGRRIIMYSQEACNPPHRLWSYENGLIISKHSGLVIDAQPELGRGICQYNRNKGINNQLWAIDSEGFIYSISNPDLVLGILPMEDWNGADVSVYTRKSENNLNQKWEIVMVEE